MRKNEEISAAGWETLLEVLGAAGADRAERLARLSDDAWRQLCVEADLHWVAPLLYRFLCDEPSGIPAPATARWALRRSYRLARACARRAQARLEPILKALDSAGIGVVLLKGMHLAAELYGDPATRPMVDADLLIRREDLPGAGRILAAFGYRQAGHRLGSPAGEPEPPSEDRHHLAAYYHPQGPAIELHHDIEAPSRMPDIAVGGLWERARPARLGTAPALVLSPEDALLHLCVHATFHHGFAIKLLSLYDIAFAADRWQAELDWSVFWERAREWGAERSAAMAFAFVGERMRAAMPAGALAVRLPCSDLERGGWLDAATLQMRARADLLGRRTERIRESRRQRHQAPRTAPQASRIHLRRIASFHARLGVVRRRIFVSNAELASWFGFSQARAWVILLHPIRWGSIARQRDAKWIDRFFRRPIRDEEGFACVNAWTLQLERRRLVAWLAER